MPRNNRNQNRQYRYAARERRVRTCRDVRAHLMEHGITEDEFNPIVVNSVYCQLQNQPFAGVLPIYNAQRERLAAFVAQFVRYQRLSYEQLPDRGIISQVGASTSQNLLLNRSGGDELESCLKSFDPALVLAFRVEEAFDSDTWQHLGRSSVEAKGYHAMMLVGVIKEDDQYRYLLQNLWKRKALVEVDAECLQSCFASITFVQTPQTSIGSFATNASEHVECEMLDAQETFTSEG
ncbi:hypothetical protein MIR68_002518 [Amoeboaphelidium protococcarum]|nr:hypothetical protein MIR68_002518 [Amoeboaphelidium protococcarum]